MSMVVGADCSVQRLVRSRSIASIRFFSACLPPCVVTSTPSATGQDGGYGKLDLVLDGKIVISQDGRQAVLGAGDFAFTDVGRYFRVMAGEGVRLVGVVFPLWLLAVPHGVLDGVTATRMSGGPGSGAVLSALLTSLEANLDGVRFEEEAGVSSAVGGLLTAVLCAADRRAEEPAPPLVTRIRRFVDAELPDPELSPAAIAAAHHISLRQLHRLFEHEGMTVAELIRTRRLENCRHDLVDPALRRLSITEVAARWGIPDSARFSRIFRAAYGVSPREYRAGAGARAGEGAGAGLGLGVAAGAGVVAGA